MSSWCLVSRCTSLRRLVNYEDKFTSILIETTYSLTYRPMIVATYWPIMAYFIQLDVVRLETLRKVGQLSSLVVDTHWYTIVGSPWDTTPRDIRIGTLVEPPVSDHMRVLSLVTRVCSLEDIPCFILCGRSSTCSLIGICCGMKFDFFFEPNNGEAWTSLFKYKISAL